MPDSTDAGTSPGWIAGLTVGIVFIGLVGGMLCLLYFRKRRQFDEWVRGRLNEDPFDHHRLVNGVFRLLSPPNRHRAPSDQRQSDDVERSQAGHIHPPRSQVIVPQIARRSEGVSDDPNPTPVKSDSNGFEMTGIAAGAQARKGPPKRVRFSEPKKSTLEFGSPEFLDYLEDRPEIKHWREWCTSTPSVFASAGGRDKDSKSPWSPVSPTPGVLNLLREAPPPPTQGRVRETGRRFGGIDRAPEIGTNGGAAENPEFNPTNITARSGITTTDLLDLTVCRNFVEGANNLGRGTLGRPNRATDDPLGAALSAWDSGTPNAQRKLQFNSPKGEESLDSESE